MVVLKVCLKNSNFAHKDSILLKNIQDFGFYRNIYEAIQLLRKVLETVGSE